MNYLIKEVIRTMEYLERYSKSLPKAKPIPGSVKEGLDLSQKVCRQEEFVHPTPWMKNLMITLGDVKQEVGPDGEYHTTKLKVGEKSKAVSWMEDVMHAALLKYNGPEKHDYDENLPCSDPTFYDIDCWNGGRKNFWDVVPGQEKETQEGFLAYKNPKTNISVEEVIRLIKSDPALQKAIEIEFSIWPEVRASKEVREISDPFMSKKTGVSYPDFRNDSTMVSSTLQKKYGKITYGKYEIEKCVEALESGGLDGLIKFALDNNICTGYCRRQRGKGRPLIAMSRRSNLVVNMVNGPEQAAWKEDPRLNAAFLPEEGLLNKFSILGEFLLREENSDLQAGNIDGTKWDRNLGLGWICLQDALRYIKGQGEFTKRLIAIRYHMNARTQLLDGISRRLYDIFGRMISGYDDTTLGNSGADRLISRYYRISIDPKYVERVIYPLKKMDLFVVGDDSMSIGKKGTLKDSVKLANNKCKIVIHEDEKHFIGLMFIQWRAIKLDGKWIMAYNWRRVCYSMASKEEAKMLGQYGWILAAYQQLGKVLQYPKMLAIPLNIYAALDPNHLELDTPVSEIIRRVKEEDQARIKQGAANRKYKLKRTTDTATRLFNSNPNISGVIVTENGKVELDENYFVKVQDALKAVYDPNFLPSLGFANPDLSKIKN